SPASEIVTSDRSRCELIRRRAYAASMPASDMDGIAFPLSGRFVVGVPNNSLLGNAPAQTMIFGGVESAASVTRRGRRQRIAPLTALPIGRPLLAPRFAGWRLTCQAPHNRRRTAVSAHDEPSPGGERDDAHDAEPRGRQAESPTAEGMEE